jgi:L-fuconolactonase
MEAKPRITRRRWLRRAGSAALAAVGSRGLGVRVMAANPTGLRIIDPHVHVWKNDARYPWPADLARPPAEDALPETLLDLMRAHGVERTVIVHVIYYRWDCRYAADAVRARPDKFMGVCRIAGAGGDWIRDVPRMDAIWSRAAELKVPMCVLCSIDRIPDVERVIERHQGRFDVCIDHMADCPIDRLDELKKLLSLARYERVYVKLSHLWSLSREAYPYRDTHDQVRRLYDAFGPERLMWGTDWPGIDSYCGYERALALYRDEIKFFNDDDRKWILGQTALKLWPFASAS